MAVCLCCRSLAVQIASPLVTVSIVQPEQTNVNYSNVTNILQTLQKYEQTVNSIIGIMDRVRACVIQYNAQVKHQAVTIRDNNIRPDCLSIML